MSNKPTNNKIIKYLKKLWCSNEKESFNSNYNNYTSKYNFDKIYNYILNYIANFYYRFYNKFEISSFNDNLSNYKKLGFTIYNDGNNNEQPINKNISKKEIKNVLDFKNGSLNTRYKIMKKISNCSVFLKHKSGNYTDPDNFRYYINHENTIKILDRIWYYEIIKKCNQNLPDHQIFKVSFKLNNLNNLSDLANNNTLSRNNVLLLDLIKAYDSLEWYVIEYLLLKNFKRKMNIFYSIELVQQYMIILKERVVNFNYNNKLNKNSKNFFEIKSKNKKIIKISKGIPTGLPSSILVFTFIMEEIILEWMEENRFYNYIDFIINIYVDDIYIKFLNLNKINLIITSLINQFNKYKLFINFNKSKIDKNLLKYNLLYKFKELNETDLYLGIPFTRNKILYSNIIIKNLYKKHKLNYTWLEIYDILISENHKDKKKLVGFLNYKLKPLQNNNDNLCDLIKTFI
jgi:hypothetical protein